MVVCTRKENPGNGAADLVLADDVASTRRAIPADQFEAEEDEKAVPLIERPPVEDFASTSGLKEEVEKGEVRMRIDLEKWMAREDVKAAWKRLVAREGLEKDAFEKATWVFLNFVMGRNYDLIISMNKAWKLVVRDWADAWDALEECLDELEEEKVLPRTRRSR
ncbi:hypothetical protein BO78DRAFT_417517 [Aspergillus sclerotiicarbonarius CBS 121057]|uniref:Uncharacterized protein n=1 Tax=Aspergillus sclerotiicarbonarius (strain CBS 121057 / IBT 28362) TaxID=1448318 RepID=A0A319EYZ5_ASPSB|nr:hypothetical protein BO78DRAFT_417517 [Aspergillus sclerotiicarbonarius CBS 121057]